MSCDSGQSDNAACRNMLSSFFIISYFKRDPSVVPKTAGMHNNN